MRRINFYKSSFYILAISVFTVLYLFVYDNKIGDIDFIYDNKKNSSGSVDKVEKIIMTERQTFVEDTNLFLNGPYWEKKEPKKNQGNNTSKNFVIFNSQHYTGSLGFLATPNEGWSVFVVNVNSNSQLESCPQCLTFDKLRDANLVLSNIADENSGLDQSILQQMAAVLYASYKKAPWIYVTNKPASAPLDIWTSITGQQPTKGLVYRGPDHIFQPCKHFMDTFTWNGKDELKNQNQYTLRSLPNNSLYQIVDQCYREGMPAHWQSLLDMEAPPPFVKTGLWVAVDFSNILVPQNAFWTLVASMPLTSSSSSSYLSAIVQRLLWETPNAIGFYPGSPSVSACPTCDMEISLRKLGKSQLLSALTNWSCKSKKDQMLVCLEELMQNVLKVEGNTNELKLVENIISTWVSFVNFFQISTSKRSTLTKQMLGEKDEGNRMYFTPAKSLHKDDGDGKSLPPNFFRDECGDSGEKYKAYIPDRHPKLFEKVLLVISFNFNQFLITIHPLEYLFGRHFKHILYCATKIESFENIYLYKNNTNPVSFVDVDITDGMFGHLCMAAAMEMNYNVTGYLYMSDDVMISMWNMHKHPFHLPWFQSDILVVNLNSTHTRGHVYGNDWYPWNKPTGKPAITKVINRLKQLQNDQRLGQRVSWFLNNLAHMTSCDNCIAYMDADLYYIPSYMSSDFLFFVPYFTGVFQELSIPTILTGITPQSDRNIYRLRGSYLIGEKKREHFDYAWSHEELFIHPVKLSFLKNPKVKKFYCDIIHWSDKDLSKNVSMT